MLTNFDIDDLSEHYGFPLSQIVMKDELKTISPKNGNYIVDLESSTQGDGTHWLCVVVRGKKCFYFDQFGVLPPTEVIDFCRRIPKSHLAYSTFEIQNIKADTCGWFCCALLIYIHENPSKDLYVSCSEYMSRYSHNTTKNNAILKSFFRGLPKSRGFKLLGKLYSQK
jgi:hypothetical protein